MADLKETQGPHGPMLYGTQLKAENDDGFQRKVEEKKEQQVCFQERLVWFHKASWGQRTKKRYKEEGFHNEVQKNFLHLKVYLQKYSRDWEIKSLSSLGCKSAQLVSPVKTPSNPKKSRISCFYVITTKCQGMFCTFQLHILNKLDL